MDQTYLDEVQRQLIANTLSVSPGRADSCEATFYRDLTVDCPLFDKYRVVMDNVRYKAVIYCYLDGKVAYRFNVNRGVFDGRDSTGAACIMTHPDLYLVNLDTFDSYKRAIKDDPAPKELVQYFNNRPEDVDWESYLNTQVHEIKNDKVVAVFVANNREYALATLDSVRIPKGFDCVVFVDKSSHPAMENLQPALVEYAEKRGFQTVARPRNFGTGQNILQAKKYLFNDCYYDRVLCIEEGLRVSKSYVKFVDSMLTHVSSKFPAVVAAQGYRTVAASRINKVPHLRDVIDAVEDRWWGYIQTRESWLKTQSYILDFAENFLGASNYKDRPYEAIRVFLRRHTARMPRAQVEGGVLRQEAQLRALERLLADGNPHMGGEFLTGQDMAHWVAFETFGLQRVCPLVNRAVFFGKNTQSYGETEYNNRGYGLVTLDEFPQDAKINNFQEAANGSTAVTRGVQTLREREKIVVG